MIQSHINFFLNYSRFCNFVINRVIEQTFALVYPRGIDWYIENLHTNNLKKYLMDSCHC
jgi:hypothetical protein